MPELYTTAVDSHVIRGLGIGEAQLLAVSGAGELAVLIRPQFQAGFGLRGTLAVVPQLGALHASSSPTCSMPTGPRTE